MWKASAGYRVALQPVGGHYPGGRMILRRGHHSLQAFGKNEVICKDELAILAVGRNLAKRGIVILENAEKRSILVNPKSPVLCCVAASNLSRVVCAAVVDDHQLPVLVGLRENALNTFRQMVGAVIDWRYETDKGLVPLRHMNSIHVLTSE